MKDPFLTVDNVRQQLGFSKSDPVLKLIQSGELRAVNVSAGTGRASWRIRESDLAKFLESRQTSPQAKPAKRPLKAKAVTSVTKYF